MFTFFKKKRTLTRATTLYFLFWTAYFSWFWLHAFTLTPTGNLLANHINIWGDWAAHFTMGSSLAYKDLFTTQSPFVIGEVFRYSYGVNWLTALLIKTGIPFITAFTFISFVTSITCVISIWYFYKTWLKSEVLACLASMSFLLNGGVGGVLFIFDVLTSKNPWTTLFNPAHEYTRIDSLGIKWMSVIDSMIIPQRAFALGFPIAVFAITLLFKHFFQSKKSFLPAKKFHLHPNQRFLIGSALGLLPLLHLHSYLNAAVTLAIWCLGTIGAAVYQSKKISPNQIWQLSKPWLEVAVPAMIGGVVITQILFKAGTGFTPTWLPGWYAQEMELDSVWFWWLNWGITPYLALAGSIGMIKNTKDAAQKIKTLSSVLPFWILFIVGNMWLFQPFTWDNTKFFVWAQLGFSGLAVFALSYMWKYAQKQKNLLSNYFIKLITALLFTFLISAGTVDAFRILRIHLHQYTMYSAEELSLAELVKTNTSPQSIWLTGDKHNHWLFNLTGRQTLMAYRGWLWTHGYSYKKVEQDVLQMLQQPEISQNLFTQYNVSYIVIGLHEQLDLRQNSFWFSQHCNTWRKTTTYQIVTECRWQ